MPRVGSSSFSAAFSSFLACCLSLSPDCDLVFFVSFFCLFVCFYYEKRSCKKKIYLHTTRPTSLPPYIVPRLPSSYRGKREDLVYSCTWSCYRQFFILAGLFLAIYKLKKKKTFFNSTYSSSYSIFCFFLAKREKVVFTYCLHFHTFYCVLNDSCQVFIFTTSMKLLCRGPDSVISSQSSS